MCYAVLLRIFLEHLAWAVQAPIGIDVTRTDDPNSPFLLWRF